MNLVVAVGDLHAQLPLALRGLRQLEAEFAAPIQQVFAVGDVGLFLTPADWRFLTGPSKHKHPEHSAAIAKAWAAWPWPFAMIGGNHEPYHQLRALEPGQFGPAFSYTNAGNLPQTIPGLRVYGLSGIYHPAHYDTKARHGGWDAKAWRQLVARVRQGAVSPKELTYYKRAEVEALAKLAPPPELLLLHDWPFPPSRITDAHERPERYLVERFSPPWVCCGHHHTPSRFPLGPTTCVTLNIICREPDRHILPGWAAVFDWDGRSLNWQGFWPPLKP